MPSNHQKRLSTILAPIFLCLLLVLTGCQGQENVIDTWDGGQSSAIPSSIRTVTVQSQQVSYRANTAGLLTPARSTGVFFKDVSGPLISIEVTEYDHIAVGDAIAELDTGEYNKNMAKLDQQKQIWDLKNSITQQQLDNASYNVQLAQITVGRYQTLMQAAANRDEPLDELQYQLQRAEYQLSISRSNQTAQKLQSEISKLEYNMFMDNYEETKALGDQYVLYAPVQGVVTSISPINPGETVSKGHYILKVAEDANIVIAVQSNEATAYLKNQQDIEVIVDDVVYDAYIYTPRPGDDIWAKPSQDASANVVYIAFRDHIPPAPLYTATAFQLAIDKPKALMLDKRCVKSMNGLTYVDLLLKGQFYETPVVCGVENGQMIEIISGLSAGDVVSAE